MPTLDHLKSNISSNVANAAVNMLISQLAEKTLECEQAKQEFAALKAKYEPVPTGEPHPVD